MGNCSCYLFPPLKKNPKTPIWWYHTQEKFKGENEPSSFEQELAFQPHPQYLARAASTARASKLPSPVPAHCVRAARDCWAAAWSLLAFT